MLGATFTCFESFFFNLTSHKVIIYYLENSLRDEFKKCGEFCEATSPTLYQY